MKLLTAVLAFTLIAPVSFAEEYTSAENSWPPFTTDERDDDGIAITFVREILRKNGHTMSYEQLPWSRAINSVKVGLIDILPGVWFNDERASYFIHSDPYLYNRIVFIKKKGSPFEYDKLSSLDGLKVGVIQDYNYGGDFLKADSFSRESALNLISNVKKVIAGRIDLTLEDEIVAKTDIENQDSSLLSNIEFTANALSEVGLRIACARANPRCSKLIEDFNEGLKLMKDDGSYQLFIEANGL